MHGPAVHVEYRFGYFAFLILYKGEVGVDHFQEELGVRLGEKLNLWLARRLTHQFVTFSSDRQAVVRRKLVLPDILVEHCRLYSGDDSFFWSVCYVGDPAYHHLIIGWISPANDLRGVRIVFVPL